MSAGARIAGAVFICWARFAYAQGPRWDFEVTLEGGVADVRVTLSGFEEIAQVCSDMRGASAGVLGLTQSTHGGERALAHVPQDEDCWKVPRPRELPLRLHYHYDLKGMGEDGGDPDLVAKLGDNYLFTDEALLIRPDPMPEGAPIRVAFKLPKGMAVAAPWDTQAGVQPFVFRTSSDQFDAGSYLAVGRIHPIGEVPVRGGAIALAAIDAPHVASDRGLRDWIGKAAGSVADFYGGLPGKNVLVILAPVAGAARSGVFGTVLHRERPSVVLFYGADAADERFENDWVATHELFHLGGPNVRGRPAWIVEGVATYFQDILRARNASLPPSKVWGDLADGFARFCDPVEGVSLFDESREMRHSYSYRRVYWGGACVLFHLDVAIRNRSKGERSIDTVLRELHARGESQPLTEAQVIVALDEAAGGKLASKLLHSRQPLQTEPLLSELGVKPEGEDEAVLSDKAPLARIRRQIF